MSAYHAANQVKVGLAGFVFATIIGIVLGAGNFYLIHLFAQTIDPLMARLTGRWGEWFAGSLFVGLVVWALLAGGIGDAVSLGILHLAGWRG